MRRRWLWLLLVGGGCARMLGFEPVSSDASQCSLQPNDPRYHDEDSDGVADSCDNCPGIPNPDQANTLEIQNGQAADLVGDVCDPHPTESGDYIARIVTFVEPAIMASWQGTSGTWTFAADSVSSAANNETLLALFPQPANPFTVEIHLTLLADPVMNQFAEAGVHVDSSDSDPGVKCAVTRTLDDTKTFYVDYALANYDAGSPASGAGADLPMPLRRIGYRLVMTYDRTNSVSCVARADDDTTTGPRAQLPLAPTPTPGAISLETHNAAASYEYLIVYDQM